MREERKESVVSRVTSSESYTQVAAFTGHVKVKSEMVRVILI